MANTRFIIDLNDFTNDPEFDAIFKSGWKHYSSKENDEVKLLLIPNRNIDNGTDVYWDCDDSTYTQYLFTHIGVIDSKSVLSGTLFNHGTTKNTWD